MRLVRRSTKFAISAGEAGRCSKLGKFSKAASIVCCAAFFIAFGVLRNRSAMGSGLVSGLSKGCLARVRVSREQK